MFTRSQWRNSARQLNFGNCRGPRLPWKHKEHTLLGYSGNPNQNGTFRTSSWPRSSEWLAVLGQSYSLGRDIAVIVSFE